ncbi:MAG: rRNA cytosine-C5-methyltransferase [Prevotellaceae bacterium]|nr:rRNA cytosine-C5-methyltransferase [Prevotellaceae bacterium]
MFQISNFKFQISALFPPPFISQMQALLGADSAAFFEALQGNPPVSIRLSSSKKALPPYDFTLQVPWCDSGRCLAQRPVFTLDPLLHGGAYYVQEAASMALSQVARQLLQKEELRALDLCASPGGKTTLLADFLPQDSLLVANEAIRSRVGALTENVTKWGNPHVLVTNNDPKDFAQLPGFFDAIFVDAPCSGEGMFRKDKGAVGAWSEAGVQLCRERQRRIVADVWSALKAGGYLVYTTCTFNVKENEENVLWMLNELGASSAKLEMKREWGITPTDELKLRLSKELHGYRFFPHKTLGEGFFVAVLQKTSGNESSSLLRRQDKAPKVASTIPHELRRWLLNPNDFVFVRAEHQVKAVPAHIHRWASMAARRLNVVQEGIAVAELKGSDCVPCAALALSTALNPGAFPTVDLDLRRAQQLLKKESIDGMPQRKGFELVRYSGLPLGFIKNLGARCNNLYPQEWRIRMNLRPLNGFEAAP